MKLESQNQSTDIETRELHDMGKAAAYLTECAELDDDIASVLHLHALDPLDRELDRLDELLEAIVAARGKKESSV